MFQLCKSTNKQTNQCQTVDFWIDRRFEDTFKAAANDDEGYNGNVADGEDVVETRRFPHSERQQRWTHGINNENK